MEETYCGKTCEECNYKESLNCPGCKSGPGKVGHPDCEIASCCIGKGHENCADCHYNDCCNHLPEKDPMPANRLQRRTEEVAKQAAIAKKVPYFSKWLWILFWLIVPMTLANIISSDGLSTIAGIAYGLVLLKLAKEEPAHYRIAGILSITSFILNALLQILSGGDEQAVWVLGVSVPIAVLSLYGQYHEYMGHMEVLQDISPDGSEKWHKLWYWYIGAFCVTLCSAFIALLIPVVGAVLGLLAMLTVLIVSILKLFYLYQTAKVFREYPTADANTNP